MDWRAGGAPLAPRPRPGGASLCFSKVRLLHLVLFVPVVRIRCTAPRKPFNPQTLISHLTNSNGCGNLWIRFCKRVPVSSLLLPSKRRVSAPSSRQPTKFLRLMRKLSIICALFNSLVALFRARFLCFQQFAHSFAKMPGVGGGHTDPVFGLSAGGDQDSRGRSCFYRRPGGGGSLAHPCHPFIRPCALH